MKPSLRNPTLDPGPDESRATLLSPSHVRHIHESRGFTLIVTLSMMILLTVIAVGLLSLSSVSLRTASHGGANATAQSNARLALMLAIGELQKAAGSDTRITAPANLVNPGAPAGITGVWNSWKPDPQNPDYQSAKSGANFQGYLMSGGGQGSSPDPQSVPAGAADGHQLVGPGSVGTGNGIISVPPIEIAGKTRGVATGEIAWITLDEGVKSRIDLGPADEASAQADRITRVGSPARNGFEDLSDLAFLNADTDALKLSLPKLVSLNQASLESSDDAIARYFHDFTVSSSSVQADVANGGLKTDLSVLFDGAYGDALPSDYQNRYLYSDSAASYEGATSDVQWGLYANYMRLYRRTTPRDNPLVGLKAALPPVARPTDYLKKTLDRTARKDRFEPNMANIKQPILMPTVLRVDTLFSLVVRDAHGPWTHPTYPDMLHLMYLPVITLHNPYNVPLKTTNMRVEFSDIPIGFQFLINGQPVTNSGIMSLNEFHVSGAQQKKFILILSDNLNSTTEVVMGPGETRIFGTPFTPGLTWATEVAANGNPNAGAQFFDWGNNLAGALNNPPRIIPGMITGPNDGIGFDVDWLAPSNRSAAHRARADRGVVNVRAQDDIKVQFGPKAPPTAQNTFNITVKLGNQTAGTTQVFYMNEGRLKTVVEEGTSPRFPEDRSFPATFPASNSSPLTAADLYESNSTPIRKYENARPFAIFSVGAKTTAEAFTESRPVADTGIAFQMATVDFTSSESQGSSPLEFALVPVKNGSAAVESGGPDNEHAFFFGGHGATNGTTAATIYEIPLAPLQSIAQLRHANGASIGSVPYVTYSVGESRAHPAVPAAATFVKPDTSRTVLDHSWLANDRLWDAYWLSTLSTLAGVAYSGSTTQEQLATTFFESGGSLPNPRNSTWLPSGKSAADAAEEAITEDGKRSAAFILTQGAFNVNSTSVPAWVSVLSALAREDVPLASGASDTDPPGTPMLRVRQPSIGLDGNFTGTDLLWNSYRTLDGGEIETLAELIVGEIRERGPFLSVAEFVNRRLGNGGELTQRGAIQAALDRSNINSIMESNARAIDPLEIADYGWVNPSAVTGNTGAGAPGEISQGDILSAIGSFITVRSDTFRIRAYGDARDAQGNIIAQAWCEATVQRVPDYLDPTDLPHEPATSRVNQDFGRKFELVAFRWLRQSEI